MLLGVTSGLLLSLNGCGSASSGSAHSFSSHIEHVVVIFQENRSPDNLFQDPVLISRHADIAQSGLNSQGQTVSLSPIDLASNYDLSHKHSAFVAMCTGSTTELLPTSCTMNGADLIPVACDPGSIAQCPPPNLPPHPQFMYVNPSQVQPYFQLAEQYTFGDRMFQTNQGPSFPAHQFIISGTSAPTATSNLFAAENVSPGTGAGCIAPPGNIVRLIDPSGNESSSQYPCFEHATLTDRLDAKGISWRYYAPSAGSIWTGPDAIQHMCQAQTQNGQLVCTGSAWSNVIIPQKKILTDLTNNQLAQVTWVIPDGAESDHADTNDGSGPSWVASIVNAIGNSQYWSNTAIFITWDDWGGWYDHVAPTIHNSYEYGFRVPLIVVSPYAKRGYVSHVTHDYGSFLKFIEANFNLPSLGYADSFADDLSDCFDFSQTPAPFSAIAVRFDATYFLNNKSAPLDPDDD
jgi:phospholipase C